jgi:hypothetical protein
MVACSASCSGLELENLNLNLLCNTRNRRSDSDYVRVAVGPCQVGPDRGDRDQRPCRSRMARAYHVIGPPAWRFDLKHSRSSFHRSHSDFAIARPSGSTLPFFYYWITRNCYLIIE